MPSAILFNVPGHPQGKGRPRFVRATGRTYTPEQTRNYEGMIRLAAETAMAGRGPIKRPVALAMAAVFGVPKRFPRARREAALSGGEFPAKRPDIDNVVKAATDAMNGVVYRDDAQIVSVRCSKIYGPSPMLTVSVTPL